MCEYAGTVVRNPTYVSRLKMEGEHICYDKEALGNIQRSYRALRCIQTYCGSRAWTINTVVSCC